MTISQPVKTQDRFVIALTPPYNKRIALLYGSGIEGLAFLALSVLVSIQASTSEYEQGSSFSSSDGDKTWPYSDPVNWIGVALAIATLLILPVAVGYFSRSWWWTLICPVMLFVLWIVGFFLGSGAAALLALDETSDPWAGLVIIFLWFVVPVVGLIPSFIGTALGKLVHGRKAKKERQSARSAIT